ncbi:TlpA disulfide reductase family protein [Citreimonas salinaria]|uniref:Thiol-disulfide isomerase or thioredoxin n=1 Tax=Citreimonas salinaria TaxID=321339 RepID=A0A1H3NMW5_9RHOB|nr:TlpA disulfide reductase family protein [Citreimonas salinaria]SDY89765.1 Thiol-disulfide isomerase or thioredoxin [Citreimonas salinaria]
MTGVQIGPLAFDIDRFAFIVAALVFFALFHLLTIRQTRRGEDVRRWAFPAAVAWLLAARFGYVIQHWEVFSTHPLDILKLWQGGVSVQAGFFGIAAFAFVAVLRGEAAVAPIMGAAFAGWLASEAVFGFSKGSEVPGLPATAYPTLTGTPLRLDEHDGQPLVLNLWASWCPPCRREMPMMMDVAETIDGAELVFANQGETHAQVAQFLETLDLGTEHMALDPNSSLMTRFAALGLPTTLFFDASGTLTNLHFGEISRAELMSQIAALDATASPAGAGDARTTMTGDIP